MASDWGQSPLKKYFMRICITSSGQTLDSFVDPRFGRCPYFLIVNEKGKLLKVISNQGVQASRGAGVLAAQSIAKEKVEAVISGNVGPNAFMVLSQTGVKFYLGAFGLKVKEALEKFNQGQLKQAESYKAGFGQGQGFGRGPGFGRRQN